MRPCLPLAAVVALALSACAATPRPACVPGAQAAIHDTLYFGAAMPDGEVTSDAWNAFLRDVVTPRFPQGLTVSAASGQWRDADGALVREDSRVLQLIHPDDAASEQAVREIVARYKAEFRQEAVLRVRAGACVSF